jgi:kynurenine formamidase
MTVDQIDLTWFVGPAAVIDVTYLTDTGDPGQSPLIEADDIQRWEQKHGRIQEGEIVLLRTDWTDRHYRRPPEGNAFAYDPIIARSAPAWPAPSPEAMQYLVDRGVRCVGIDNNSMGPLQADSETHWVGLGQGVLFVERMTNLGQLPPRGAFFIFLPMKNEGGSGAPGRAIALVPPSTR